MTEAERLATLRLIRTEQVGPVTYRNLIARYGTAMRALEALPDLAGRSGGRPPAIPRQEVIEREIAAVRTLNARHVFAGTSEYPPLLGEVDSAPPVLIAAGDLALAARPVVAIVGARNASAAACRFARLLARDLSAQGVAIASGLARGIDTAAHDGAIDGGTIAVIAGGIDIFYPPENEARQRGIAERGLLIAEQPPGLEPRARHFPHRNRIIAGIALGTVVVEAAPRSGSLITARNAADFGREVMAVPGFPADPRAQGCNLLIREGATLVQNAEDVLEAITPGLVSTRPVEAPVAAPEDTGGAEDDSRKRVFDLLGATPIAVDELVRQSCLPAATVANILIEIELGGRLARHAGGRVSLD